LVCPGGNCEGDPLSPSEGQAAQGASPLTPASQIPSWRSQSTAMLHGASPGEAAIARGPITKCLRYPGQDFNRAINPADRPGFQPPVAVPGTIVRETSCGGFPPAAPGPDIPSRECGRSGSARPRDPREQKRVHEAPDKDLSTPPSFLPSSGCSSRPRSGMSAYP